MNELFYGNAKHMKPLLSRANISAMGTSLIYFFDRTGFPIIPPLSTSNICIPKGMQVWQDCNPPISNQYAFGEEWHSQLL